MQADFIPKIPDPSWVWWKDGVIYHIYPRSFSDSNGDGIGDLQGITCKLQYLKELGVDAIWLSPVYNSPNFDYGYDVADYKAINPEYGTLEDFRQLLAKCHELGIRVIMDMILNHTSFMHPWFLESMSSRLNPKHEWYIWRDGVNGKKPTNWRSATGGSAWEYSSTLDKYYLHSFFSEQPDLNWRNPEVFLAFSEELKFWLDLGVDGFRLDAINMIGKDKKFRNNPNRTIIPLLNRHKYNRDRPISVKIVRRLRKLLDRYEERAAIGEIYMLPPGNPIATVNYLSGVEKGIHLAFDFSLIFSPWNARQYYRRISDLYSKIPEQGWPCNVLSNHDLFRSINRHPWSRHQQEKARIAAFLLLTLRGTPFIYYGEEIGMKNGKLKRKDIRDPLGLKYWPVFKGRDRARTPMQWTNRAQAGFTTGFPWLPLNPDFQRINVETQDMNPDSLLNLYKSLILLRKNHPALQIGRWVPILNGKNGILAYLRRNDEEVLFIVLNFTGKRKMLSLHEHFYGEVLLSTHRPARTFHFLEEMKADPYEATIYKISIA